MLAVLFALTAIALITAHHFLVEKPRQRAAAERAPPLKPIPLLRMMGQMPEGIFLQNTYTCGQIQPSGEILIGLHPLLLNLVGDPYELDLLVRGRARKGMPLVRLSKGDRSLIIPSPVSGRILEVKHLVDGQPNWDRFTESNRNWLARIKPERIADELPSWMIADSALEWTRRQYGEIRNHLLKVGSEGELGLALADGGEIPVGILAELGESEWKAFQEAFLNP